MKVFIIGSGGREHSIAWKVSHSKHVKKIFVAPGNAGTSMIAKNIEINPENVNQLVDFALKEKIDLTVVGPEAPLADGIVDIFQKNNLKIFGPNKHAAILESSKVFAKNFMKKWGVETAEFRVFKEQNKAMEFLKNTNYPKVLKVDGLAAGKGVIILKDYEEACKTLEEVFVGKKFGKAGEQVVIEDFLEGEEISVLSVLDGKSFVFLLPSQDHKKIFDGDKGPNTGGMGAYCPVSIADSNVLKLVEDRILMKTINGLKNEGIEYKGVLYLGIMLTKNGPSLLEYNVRFGDPETQPILSLMESDIVELFIASIEGKLSNFNINWNHKTALCVVIASNGYPGKYEKGKVISGLDVADNNTLIFHAGTILKDNNILTNGGRVLNVVGIGKDIKEAFKNAYERVKSINFEGIYFRKDIGLKELNRSGSHFSS